MIKRSIRTQEMADLLGVTPQTVRKYVREDGIPHHVTEKGRLYFTSEDVKKIMGEEGTFRPEVWAFYIRSSSGDKEAMRSQEEKLSQVYPRAEFVIKDRASGLNEIRKGLDRLFELAHSGKITDVAVTRDDRLTRFGYKYVERLLSNDGVKIHVLSSSKDKTIEEELMDDFMTILASFSGRFSRMKSRAAQKNLLERAKNKLEN